MPRSEVITLCQALCTNQADETALSKYYDEVVSDLGRAEWLVNAEVLSATAGTNQYNPASTVVEIMHVLYDDRVLSKETLRSMDAYNPQWRDQRGTPRAYIVEDETNKQFRLWPTPEVDSKPFIPLHGAILGLDYPEYSVVVIQTEFREVLPIWMELPVAFAMLAREFARESDHIDTAFAESCDKLSKVIFEMLGP